MLSSILNYLEGSVTLLSESNDVVIRLSDGGIYNAADFGTMSKTVTVLICRAANPKELDATAAELEELYEHAPVLEPIAAVPDPIPTRYATKGSPLIISFGKYKGRKLGDIEDATWLDWVYSKVQLRVERGRLLTVPSGVTA
jgi:hypothetical protein